MRVDRLDFELPPELIAQRPAEARDAARLLVLDRRSGGTTHAIFHELGGFLRSGDTLVLNDTRVERVRLFGRKPTGGRVELLLVRPGLSGGEWEVLTRGLRNGTVILGDDGAEARVREGAGGRRYARFNRDVSEVVDRYGRVPLPPYISRPDDTRDRERYQTVYARTPGAVAAPTAGLHFTPRLLREFTGRGIRVASVTLHVGPGTFRPVTAENIADHLMDEEWYEIPPETVEILAETRESGGRIVAVGTTATRTLESAAADGDGVVRPGEGAAGILIHPGYRFRIIDGIITNFHLPRSTPLFLAAAVAGPENLLRAYGEAVARRYRFYSYGDAMLIL